MCFTESNDLFFSDAEDICYITHEAAEGFDSLFHRFEVLDRCGVLYGIGLGHIQISCKVVVEYLISAYSEHGFDQYRPHSASISTEMAVPKGCVVKIVEQVVKKEPVTMNAGIFCEHFGIQACHEVAHIPSLTSHLFIEVGHISLLGYSCESFRQYFGNDIVGAGHGFDWIGELRAFCTVPKVNDESQVIFMADAMNIIVASERQSAGAEKLAAFDGTAAVSFHSAKIACVREGLKSNVAEVGPVYVARVWVVDIA